jgi:hypothetical protein
LLGDKDENCKYVPIVKFNLDHKAYFSKRDKLVGFASDKDFNLYWQACILNIIGV